MPDGAPADPFGGQGLAEAAAQMAEMYTAFCAAGIPPQSVAVLLGTWMATAGNGNQPGGDGT
jgi:hypothetical protein